MHSDSQGNERKGEESNSNITRYNREVEELLAPQESKKAQATVLITTKDRKQLLARAIESVLAQSVPVELLIVDDGSSDGTWEMVVERFPQAKLIRNEQPLGIIAARNVAAHEASTDILFTLDDDAVFSDVLVVARAIKDMQHERVGAVAIPLVNHIGGEMHVVETYMDDTSARENDDFLCAFVFKGGANALRKSLFLELRGYEGAGRQGEEHTYCIRMLNAGYVVRVASHGHVDHFPIPVHRDKGQILRCDMSNSMLFAWLYVPWPPLLYHLPGVVVNRLIRGLKRGKCRYELGGALAGCFSIWRARRERRPVNRGVYQLTRDLITRRTLTFSQVEPRLPPRQQLR